MSLFVRCVLLHQNRFDLPPSRPSLIRLHKSSFSFLYGLKLYFFQEEREKQNERDGDNDDLKEQASRADMMSLLPL